MAIKRDIWEQHFTEEGIPKWPCPRCKAPLMLEESTLKFGETAESHESRRYDGWEEEFWNGMFSANLKCLDNRCQETVVVVRYSDYTFLAPDYGLLQRFHPQFFSPALNIFDIPPETPEDVALEIYKAFSAFWSDTASAGNRVRSSVERILNQRKIKKTTIKYHKRKYLNLHARIELFAVKYPDIGDELLAVKWLGNEASHIGDLSKDDIFNAFEILEQDPGFLLPENTVIHEVFDRCAPFKGALDDE